LFPARDITGIDFDGHGIDYTRPEICSSRKKPGGGGGGWRLIGAEVEICQHLEEVRRRMEVVYQGKVLTYETPEVRPRFR
jgi:hypothetical protein